MSPRPACSWCEWLIVSDPAFPPGGTTDASVIAVAERLGVTEIATIDSRHFPVVRPLHFETFTLLPEQT
jgi:hypothetical protein